MVKHIVLYTLKEGVDKTEAVKPCIPSLKAGKRWKIMPCIPCIRRPRPISSTCWTAGWQQITRYNPHI